MRPLLALAIVIIACNASPSSRQNVPSSSNAVEADTVSSKKASINSPIAAIRTEYSRINSLKLDSTRYTFLCDEQARVTVLKEGDSIVKAIVDWGWVGDAATVEEWYYQHGSLIFRYVRSEGAIGNEPAKVYEARTYVKDDKVIRYLQNSREVPCTGCRFTATSKEYALLRATSNEQMKAALCR